MPAVFNCGYPGRLCLASASAKDPAAVAAGKADQEDPKQTVAAASVSAAAENAVAAAAECEQKQENKKGVGAGSFIASASTVCSSQIAHDYGPFALEKISCW